MPPSYSFAVDAPRRFVRLTMAGFWTVDDVTRFRTGLEQVLGCLKAGPNRHRTLVDIRDMKVQSQESVAGFQKIFNEPAYRSERLAIVVASSLARSQVKRAAEGRGAEYFDSTGEAEAWLFDGEPLPKSSARLAASRTHHRIQSSAAASI